MLHYVFYMGPIRFMGQAEAEGRLCSAAMEKRVAEVIGARDLKLGGKEMLQKRTNKMLIQTVIWNNPVARV